jgi:hypothetical protein
MRLICLLVVTVAASAVACNKTMPTAPTATNSQTPPSASTPALSAPFTLSGVVYESTADGVRPLAGVPLDVSVEYQQWPPKVISDNQGRYSVVLGKGQFKVAAQKEGFVQPCRANIDLKQSRVLDIFLVSIDLLAIRGMPLSLPIIEPTLIGLVFERTANGVQPVAGARVLIDFSGGFGLAVSANTVSGPDGRFLLCNVTDVGFAIGISARKSPLHSDFIGLFVPFPKTIDIEVRREP